MFFWIIGCTYLVHQEFTNTEYLIYFGFFVLLGMGYVPMGNYL